NFNALNISARTFVNAIDDRNRMVLEITIATRFNLGESITTTSNIFGNCENRIFDFLGAVRLTRTSLDQMIQGLPVNAINIALDAYIAECIALTFINRDGD